jgi:transketolase
MRVAFRDTLIELAENDERVVLLTADLGFAVLEPFAERFPERFYNVGVAEQNMLGMATGLAEAGSIPFVYSIATFATMRPYEFIRNGPLLHQFPIRVIGVGGGFDYGFNGMTHFALEDLALMRVQPGMTVLAPADSDQTRAALLATANLPGPVYLRVGREGSCIAELAGRFELGRLELILDGADIAIVSTGSITHEAVRASRALGEIGIDAAVAVAASLSPPPREDLALLLSRYSVVFVLEEHYVDGALGSLVCEVSAEDGLAQVVRCGVREMARVSGSQEFLRHEHGISADALVERVVRHFPRGEVKRS